MFKLSPTLRQYAVVIIANLTLLNLGVNVVWPSPILVKLRDDNQNILLRSPTESEEAWIVSIATLGGIPALLFTGALMNSIGRKLLLCLVYVPRLLACLLAIFATDVWMILLCRAVGGLSDLMTISTASTYASEVAGKQIRGASGTVTQIMSSIGMMIMLAVGPFVSYLAVNLMMLSILIITFIPMVFIPESPYFLYSKGHTEKAVEVLTTLRGSEALAHEQIKDYALAETETDMATLSWSYLKDKTVIKTIILVIFLAIGVNAIGYNAVNFYLQTIFESTQTSISSEVSSLIIGVIQLLACCCTFFLTDRFGRKPLLCISLIAMFIGMIGLGTFFVWMDNGNAIVGFMNVLPLLSIIIIIYGYNAGMGSLYFIVLAELFEGPIRSYGLSCTVGFGFLCSFVVTLYFPSLMTTIGPGPTYYIFSSACVLLCLHIFFFIPETKGKSFVEIQIALGKRDVIIDEKEKV